jgi:SAM-dependent methyltransferase
MDYARYLAAKRPVDDRALNTAVLDSFQASLRNATTPTPTLRVLEVGAGIGAMAVRLIQRGAFTPFRNVEYTLVDIKPDLLATARALTLLELAPSSPSAKATTTDPAPVIRSRAISGAHAVHRAGLPAATANIPPLTFRTVAGSTVELRFLVADGLAHAQDSPGAYDAVVAAAFLDLVDLDAAASALLGCLDRGRGGPAAFYFPVTFDGVTCFSPAVSGADAVLDSFHAAMGRDGEGGWLRAQAGRRLLGVLRRRGADVRAAGGAAWVVVPTGESGYPGDEGYFLECIVEFIGEAVCGTGEDGVCVVERLRDQVKKGVLEYVAQNMDYTGVLPPL